MKNIVLKYVLKNALEFEGKPYAKAILGPILKDHPELKKDVPALMKEIEKTAAEVQQLPLPEIKKQLQKIAPEMLKKEKEEAENKIAGPLKPLPNAQKGKFVVRIAPSPSGPLHIGHAYGASLNYEYAKMYQGKFILRIEDTNPENIYPQAYELIERDARWLSDNNVSQVVIQSSRLGIYYDQAEKLVTMGKAYVCTCDADKWRDLKGKGIACSCRDLSVKEQQQRYAKMFNQYAEGEAVLRLKTNIKDNNPAMRDFPIMRINEHYHPKTKNEQKVLPLMIFSVAVDDHELGITHVLNGKDHADNAQKEALIMKLLGWKAPEYKHWGRINFAGFELSTSKTRLAIEQKEYSGWEDIRLPFLPALRKRGYQAGAFRKFALELGLSLTDKTVSIEEFWKIINSFNREIIEPKANRYFFVNEPAEVSIEGAPKKEVLIDLHPNHPERGKRKLSVAGKVYVGQNDLKRLAENEVHRLMDYCNFEVKKGKWKFLSENYDDYKNAKKKGAIIHWLPADKKLPAVEVLLEDGTIASGWGEKDMLNLKEGDIIQMERFAYCRLDKKEGNKMIFYYLHR